jgi:hypothetical protein
MTVVEQDRIDFTMMYTTHHAFRRDLDRLISAAAVGKDSTSLVRDGWENFKIQQLPIPTDTSFQAGNGESWDQTTRNRCHRLESAKRRGGSHVRTCGDGEGWATSRCQRVPKHWVADAPGSLR